MKTKKNGVIASVFAMTLAFALMVGVTYAQDVNYQGTTTGYWDDPTVWNLGVAPTNDTNAKIFVAPTKTVTLTNSATIRYLALNSGDGTTDLIIDGGSLHAVKPDSSGWNAVGYNKSASLIIRNGGTYLVDGRLDIGLLDNDDSAVCSFTMEETSGDVVVSNDFSAGFNYDGSNPGQSSRAYIEGGTLYVGGNLNIANSNCFVDVKKTGKIVISGNDTTNVNTYVADGWLLGNSAVSNTLVVYDGTNTTITALAPAVFDYTGLDISTATNNIVNDGFSVGSITETYVYGMISGQVISQDPPGGTTGLSGGDPIALVIQEALATNQVTVDWSSTGPSSDWADGGNWNGGIAPTKETENFKVRTFNSRPIVLTNFAAVSWLVLGDGGSTPTSLTITNGGHLVAGGSSDGSSTWTSIGYSRAVDLTITEDSTFETKNRVLYGWGAGASGTNYTSSINIDGGTFICGGWLGFGNKDNNVFAEVNVDNGGLFDIERFNYTDRVTNGVINMIDGTMIMDGNRTNEFQSLIDVGMIVIDGAAKYQLDYGVVNSGRSTLTVFVPGYAAWAGLWGVNIGSETNDYDDDLANNLYEYALNGDPTDDQDPGQEPVLINNGGALEYAHQLRADDTNLVYTVQTRDSLTIGDWVDAGFASVTNVPSGDYNVITNMVDTTDPQAFIRLKIENP